jgi:hypothetical protein
MNKILTLKSGLLFTPLILFSSCMAYNLSNGQYFTKRTSFDSSKIEIRDDNRFVYESIYESTKEETSGNYQVAGTIVKFSSDIEPIKDSYVVWQPSNDKDSLEIEILFEDWDGAKHPVSASVIVYYKNGLWSKYRTKEGSYLNVSNSEIKSLSVQWLILAVPLSLEIDQLESNRFQVTLVKSSLGSTKWNSKEFILKRDRLVEQEGTKRVFKRGG